MSENGALTALGRIERALARIEAATARAPQPPANERQMAELAARHDALRAETRQALADLDKLLSEAR